MAATSNAINIFLVSYGILFALALFTPAMSLAMGQPLGSNFIFTPTVQHDNSIPQIIINYGGFFASLFTCIFWQFGLPVWFNFVLFVPRLLVFISLYYIIFPTK